MEDRSQQILAVGVLFLCLCWISVSLRVYTRAVIVNSFGTDDWTMLASLFFITGYIVCQLGGVYYGSGRMDNDLTEENKMKALRVRPLAHTRLARLMTCSIGSFASSFTPSAPCS